MTPEPPHRARIFRDLVRFIFLCRVPIAMGLTLCLLPILAATSLRALLQGVFTLAGFWDLSLVFGLILFSVWSVRLLCRTVFYFGLRRYALEDFRKFPWYAKYRRAFWVVWIVLAVPGIAVVSTLSESGVWLTAWSFVAGIFWAGVGIQIPFVLQSAKLKVPDDADWLIDTNSPSAKESGDSTDDVKTPEPTRIEADSDAPSGAPTPPAAERLRKSARDAWAGWLKILGEGYLNSSGTALHPGTVVLAWTFATFLMYFILFGIVLFRPGASLETEMSTLFYVLILVNVLAYMLTGLTFFFDYFRVPLLALVLVSFVAVYSVTGVDHYFRVTPRAGDWVSVGDAIKTRAGQIPNDARGQKTAVIVTASGGGIQSAAWTAQVLTGLTQRYGADFARSIVLISAVSGGSVGTMHYLNSLAYWPATDQGGGGSVGGKGAIEAFHSRTAEAAARSGLEAVGWGLVYPDLARLSMLSFIVPDHIDRGWALERAWEKALAVHVATPERSWTQAIADWTKRLFTEGRVFSEQPRTPTFGDWEREIRRGALPIPVFNATVVETGERLILSPVSVESERATDFHCLYPRADIRVVTAARLSATFPYVTPVARMGALEDKGTERRRTCPEPLPYHVADGGYYDNYGVMTVVDWLNRFAFELLHGQGVHDVLLIQIELGEPISAVTADTSGWKSAFLGPLSTLYNVRETTQRTRNELELDLLQRAWQQSFAPLLKPAVFRYSGPTVLSWKLTTKEKAEIRRQWEKALAETGTNAEGVGVTDCFFAAQGCPSH